MSSGQYRERLRIERRGKVSDGSGGYIEAWETVHDAIPAQVYHKTGSEAVLSERIKGVVMMEIKVRYSSRTSVITSDDRLVDERGGDLYNVIAVLPDQKRRVIVITAKKGVLQ